MKRNDNTLYNKKFGEIVKAERLKMDLSQNALSELVGVSRVTISRVEEGLHSISLGHALSIAKVLNISLDRILYSDNSLEKYVSDKYSGKEHEILRVMNSVIKGS